MGLMQIAIIAVSSCLVLCVGVLAYYSLYHEGSYPTEKDIDPLTSVDEDGWEYKNGLYVNGPRQGKKKNQ